MARLREEAQAIQDAGALGQSMAMIQLFEFLLQCTLAGRAPKETEIAQAVFTRSANFNGGEDATVRVNIHRLRRRLADYYLRNKGVEGPRLTIPRGEYRLSLADGASLEPITAISTPRHRRLMLLAAAVIASHLLLAFVLTRPSASEATLRDLRKAPVWSQLIGSTRPTSVVVGDYYVFGDRSDKDQIDRLIRDFTINSREDLDHQLMANPDFIGHHVDVGLHYAPTSVAPSLQRILPIVSVPREDWRRPRTLAMSETTPDRIKLSNVVYVGFFSGLGALKDPLSRASRLRLDQSGDLVVDGRTNQPYAAGAASGSSRGSDRDLAYIAAFPGPNGNRIVIVAGLRDAGLTQAAEIAASPEILKMLSKAVGATDAFEALFSVDSIETTNVGSKLIFASPLARAKLWTR